MAKLMSFILLKWYCVKCGQGSAQRFNHFFVYLELLLNTVSFAACGLGRFPLRFSSSYIFGLITIKSRGISWRYWGVGEANGVLRSAAKGPPNASQSCSVLIVLQDKGVCSGVHWAWELHGKEEAMQFQSLFDFWVGAINLHWITCFWQKKKKK